MFASLSCVALLAICAGACDSVESQSRAKTGVVAEQSEPVEVPEAAEPEVGPPALVSDTPVELEGLSPVGFDVERQLYVYDRDSDGFPDITEALEGTDMFDANDNPGVDSLDPPDEQEAGFPAGTCRPGYIQAGNTLCISDDEQNPRRYRGAVRRCRNRRGNVCSYEDLTYLYLTSSLDEYYNPLGKWIGNMPADDQVFCGNRSITFDGDPDIRNFEGTCGKNEQRSFWCCHDLDWWQQ